MGKGEPVAYGRAEVEEIDRLNVYWAGILALRRAEDAGAANELSTYRDFARRIEQMKAENVLAKYDALGQGFIKTPAFVELIYGELAGSKAAPKPATRPAL